MSTLMFSFPFLLFLMFSFSFLLLHYSKPKENGVDNAIKVIYKVSPDPQELKDLISVSDNNFIIPPFFQYLDYSQCLIETTRSLRSPLQPSQFSHMTSAVKSAISSTVKTFYFPRPATNLRSISNGYNSLV